MKYVLEFLVTVPCLIFLLIPSLANAQGSPNVTLLSNVNMYPAVGYNDCWGYTAPDGREYALLGVLNGTSIIDITDAQNGIAPEIAFIPGANSGWKDIKTYQYYAYAVTESQPIVQIIDLGDLPNSATLVNTASIFNTNPHNISIDEANGILYGAEDNSSSNGVKAFSLADPVNPTPLTSFGLDVHDMVGQDGLVYVAEGTFPSLSIYDMSTPSNPSLVSRITVPSAGYVHNVWPSENGLFMMSTEETTGKTIKYWDIANPTNPSIRSEVLDSDGQMAHNAHVKGDFAYVSHYSAGIRIYDLSDPDNVTEAGYYDTYPGAPGLYAGCWGAFPFFASGKVLASDRVTGLYVLFFPGAVEVDSLDPNPPQDVSAYSDYTMPTSMSLTWTDPSTLFGGAPLSPGEFTIEIERDGAAVGSVPGGVEQFTDNGLVDGQEYEYAIYAKLVASDSTSRSVRTSWIAGGSPIPTPPTNVGLTGDATQVTLFWRNPSVNVDGTPMDDYAGLNLYQDGTMVATFTRMSPDTSKLDSASYSPLAPGNYSWFLTAIDNETPQNESGSSEAVFTPISVPVNDGFPTTGPPNPGFWINDDADVNGRALTPPSAPYALNLNGHPDGGDVVDLRAVDLAGFQGSGITFSYAYQPQGSGNSPEPSDSLLVYFKNDLGSWVKVRGYPGRLTQSFQSEAIALASAPNGGGSYFFNQFQVRFKSLGTSSTSSFFDDWFIDDVSLSVPTAVGGSIELPIDFAVSSNYPNPFNPSTTLNYELPTAGVVRLDIYDVLGQKVRTLIDEAMDAGSHKAIWDGRNDAGLPVVSGTYIYRFEAGGFVKTQKMVLVK